MLPKYSLFLIWYVHSTACIKLRKFRCGDSKHDDIGEINKVHYSLFAVTVALVWISCIFVCGELILLFLVYDACYYPFAFIIIFIVHVALVFSSSYNHVIISTDAALKLPSSDAKVMTCFLLLYLCYQQLAYSVVTLVHVALIFLNILSLCYHPHLCSHSHIHWVEDNI